jgi:hypothetical protein
MKATGAAAVFGVQVDGPSDRYSIGHTSPDLGVITPPATSPSAASGAAGTLTGDFAFRVAYGQKDGALTSPSIPASTVGAVAFTGGGLNDLTSGGSYTGSANAVYTVKISTAAGTDKWQWKKGAGAWSAEANVVGGAMAIADGVTGTFAAATGHAANDSWTIAVSLTVVTLSAHKAELTAIPISSDPKCDRRVLDRTKDGGATWAICGTLYNNTGTTFTDDAAVLDLSAVLPAENQTGANYGFTFFEPDSFDLEPEFSNLPVMALKGTAGKPRSIPGPIKILGSPKGDLRPCELFPVILAGGGLPDSYAQVPGEPTQIAVWNATTGKRNPRTISAYTYEGSPDVAPTFLDQLATDELDIAFSGGKIDSITPKFTGANYGISAPGVKVAGTGTWGGTFVAMGQRYDADALTKSVFVKITDLLAANVVKFEVSVDTHASAGGGTYGSKYTLYTNATSHNQTKGGLQYNDAIELADQNGINLGADVGSNRQPFVLVASAPLTTDLHVGDVYEILPTAAIPGVGTAPYSGVPARFAQGPRLTDAHVTLVRDDGEVIEFTAGTLKLAWPKKAVSALCAGARTVLDMPNEGFFAVSLTITRFLDSSESRQTIRTNGRAKLLFKFEGERIPINPGVLSTYREAFYVTLPQTAYMSVKAPVPGQVLVVETITAEAEQPDSPSVDLYALALQTRQGYRIPS